MLKLKVNFKGNAAAHEVKRKDTGGQAQELFRELFVLIKGLMINVVNALSETIGNRRKLQENNKDS